MSLELEIQRLTAAIEKLNSNIALVLTTPATQVVNAQTETPEPVQETARVETEQLKAATVTHDDVQSAILAKVRASMDNKPKVKAILSEFKAAKVSDIDAAQLTAVLSKVEAL